MSSTIKVYSIHCWYGNSWNKFSKTTTET